jgi:uncharacterized damage-inducible protein DinB
MTRTDPVTTDFLEMFDRVQGRTLSRLEGLTDAEHLWEPVTGCMTVRESDDGLFRADAVPEVDPVPAPFTTIAWRMWHIGADCLRSYLGFFEESGYDRAVGDLQVWPGTASEATAQMAADWERFRGQIAELGDERLLRPMGSHAGSHSHETYFLLALHAFNEATHHAAEIGTLRDLWEKTEGGRLLNVPA